MYCTECYKFSHPYSVCIIEEKVSEPMEGSLMSFLPLPKICELKPKRIFSASEASLTCSSCQSSLWYCGSVLGQVMPSLLIVCWNQLAVGWHSGLGGKRDPQTLETIDTNLEIRMASLEKTRKLCIWKAHFSLKSLKWFNIYGPVPLNSQFKRLFLHVHGTAYWSKHWIDQYYW